MTAAADDDAPSDDPLAGGGDSACSTPFVSAPSSPTRDPFSGHHHAACFFSAPASPTRGASNEFACGGLEFDFDFDFSSRFPSSSAAAMSSADELFHNGQIRPVRLSAMLLQPHQPHLASPSQAPVEVEEGERGRFWGRSVHHKARSLSPFRAHWRSPSPAPPPESESVQPAATPPASRSSSSSSTASSASSSSSRSSRRWGFIKDLLHRSKSDGGKDNQHPAAPAPPTFPATPKSSPSPSPSPAAGRSRETGRGRRRSAHERLYEARRAEAEEMRRRTYLPYRQGGLLLFGCIGLGNRSGTAVHGLARGLNTATAVSSRS
ncbi:espin-like [Hordeum vulgare]|uniref:Calmodulin-binding protein n=1 Tax=Hordeum vulgare subsp. vulgare TaxID=112509 RepID=A0A8I7BC24_HORVV|nr:zinc finger CCCH domain-containing protein 18-like [Hordeum vulgare subsp. vulgare]KAE8773356.1 espin-like [Hordeum vulgare]